MKQLTRIAEIELGDVLETFAYITRGQLLASTISDKIVIVNSVDENMIKVTIIYASDSTIIGNDSWTYDTQWRKINKLLLRTENV